MTNNGPREKVNAETNRKEQAPRNGTPDERLKSVRVLLTDIRKRQDLILAFLLHLAYGKPIPPIYEHLFRIAELKLSEYDQRRTTDVH